MKTSPPLLWNLSTYENQAPFLMEAYRKALRSFQCAYAPYSQFSVGACLQAQDGKLISGCNVENSSYGATICAERNAVTTMVNEGLNQFTLLVLVTEPVAVPCGICLQILGEFCQPLTPFYLCNTQNKGYKTTFSELLPCGFDASSLPSSSR